MCPLPHMVVVDEEGVSVLSTYWQAKIVAAH